MMPIDAVMRKMLVELACFAIVIALIIVFFIPRFAIFATSFVAIVLIFLIFETVSASVVQPQASEVIEMVSPKATSPQTGGKVFAKIAVTSAKPMSHVVIEPNPYTPNQIASVYRGVSAFDGTGQKIAIITCFAQPNVQKDLDTFCQTYSLASTVKLDVVELGKQRDSGWEVETRLDTQWARVFAPNADRKSVV